MLILFNHTNKKKCMHELEYSFMWGSCFPVSDNHIVIYFPYWIQEYRFTLHTKEKGKQRTKHKLEFISLAPWANETSWKKPSMALSEWWSCCVEQDKNCFILLYPDVCFLDRTKLPFPVSWNLWGKIKGEGAEGGAHFPFLDVFLSYPKLTTALFFHSLKPFFNKF